MRNNTPREPDNIFLRLHPLHRILISLGVSGLVFLFTRNAGLNPLVQIMLLWDVFVLVFSITCWVVFFTRSVQQIRHFSQLEDGSRTFVFVLVLLASFASMFMVLLLMVSKEAAKTPLSVYLPVAVAGILLSWFMVHTMFTMHYAHIYYGDGSSNKQEHVGGLDFPDEKWPDYLDFAYFSFVIGMTFQVSDVEISNRTIRRLALLHGLLAFGLNTFVVALTINLIAGLRS